MKGLRTERLAQQADVGAPTVVDRLVIEAGRRAKPRLSKIENDLDFEGRMDERIESPPDSERLVLGCIDADVCKQNSSE